MNASQTLDERYFDFLCQKIGVKQGLPPSESRTQLLAQLYTHEFSDWLPNDHNRSGDGLELRDTFIKRRQLKVPDDWMGLPCSIFEMMIALAGRIAYHTDWSVSTAFWKLVQNLEMDQFHDERYNDGIRDGITRVLDAFNNRVYSANGQGGLFPLKHPRADQRDVEIWYQMHAYLQEHPTLF